MAWSLAWALAIAGPQEPPAPPPDDPLTVYLVTMDPGDFVWERFGHNGIWIEDARTGESLVWNWGLFHFDQVGFIPRLARGEMLYTMGAQSPERTLAQYRVAGRAVRAQELALTPEQKAELDRLIRINALPGNRQYRYDYYRDNCSTRVRDFLDTVLGGRLREAYEGVETGTTWRWHTLRLLKEMPLARAGIQIVLGNPGDEPIDRWQEFFLPLRLEAAVAELTVPDGVGGERPLVAREIRLLDTSRGPVPARPDSDVPGFLLAGLALGGLVLLMGRVAGRGSTPARRLLGILGLAWGVLAGVVGTVLILAYLTDHVFWYRNENLFLATPFHLGIAVAGILLLGRRARVPGWTRRLAVGLAGWSVLGVALKLLPGVDQGNAEMIVLALPLNLALAWAWLGLPQRSSLT